MQLSIPILSIATVIAFAGAAFGQFRASIEGSVLDAAHDVVPGTDITLRNPETGREQRTTSSARGFYR
ncbi:MAG: hypothetical protein QOE06_3666, partial [Thermoleophilaceae bacterium]|nr:hypothetical protein [Thermoleophilaceae bacterium]